MKIVGDYPCKASAARTLLAFLLLFFVVPLSASPDDPILILPRMAPDNVHLAVFPDGARLFAGGGSGGLFSVPDGTKLWDKPASEAMFAPDGATMAVRIEGDYSSDYYFLHDASTGALIRSFTHAGTAVRHGFFTPDGRCLLAAARSSGWNYDDEFRVWRVSDGGIISSQTWRARCASVDPTGNYLVIGSGSWLAIKSVTDTGDALQFNDLRSWQAHSR